MLKLKRLNWKVSVALVIVFVVGALAERSFFYIIQQNQAVSDTQKQPTDESIEASSDKAVAQYTEVLAWFTAILAGVGIWQGYFTAKQIKMSREKFDLSVKRPWLFASGPFHLYDENYQGDFWTFAKYFVANHGEAPAIIEDVQCDFISDIADPPLSVIRSHDLIINPIIGPSEIRKNIEAIVPETTMGEDILVYLEDETSIHLPKDTGQPLMLRIKIQYRGISSKGHESAALWCWNFTLSQFEIVGGEEHNYAK